MEIIKEQGGTRIMGNTYDELWAEVKIKTSEVKHQRELGELQMKTQENAFTIEQRYNDLNSKLDALCKYFGVKIEKQSGYLVITDKPKPKQTIKE